MAENEITDLGFEPCGMCLQLAHQARHPGRYANMLPGEVGERLTRGSALLHFGHHVGELHPTAAVPDLVPDACEQCRELETYLVIEGPDVEFPDVSGRITSGEVVRRHCLSHLIDLVPETDVS